MEKKEPIKVSLSSFFLVIAIIVIIVMGYFIYQLNNEKTKATDKIEQLNSQIKELENAFNLFKTEINKISKESTLNDNSNVSNNISKNNEYIENNVNDVQKSTEDIVKELFLKELKANNEKIEEKLVDYRVDEVKILDDKEKKDFMQYYKPTDILVLITYSVKPKDINNTLWTAGNGRIEGEWIINKSSCNYLRNGELMGGLATGW